MVTITKRPEADELPEDGPGLDGAGLDALAGIEREALALESEGAAPGGPVGPGPQGPDTAAELLQVLELVRGMARPLFADWPDFGQAWGDQTLQAMASHGGAIMDRHGWTMGEAMSQWGPYIGLLAATAPPALATMAHLKHRKAQAEAQRRAGQQSTRHDQAQPGQSAAPGQ